MTTSDIFAKVKEIIVEQLGVNEEEVVLDARVIEDLGGDSLDMLEIVMGVEEEFGVEITDEQIPSIKTVGDFVTFVENYGRISSD